MTASSEANEFPVTAPASHEAVAQAVGRHLPLFGQVLIEAWGGFATTRRLAAPQMAFAGASSRGMLVSDFTREPAHRIFNRVPEATVEDDQFGRPWVSLAGGGLRVRFRKLTSELGLCRSDSDRALSLAYHLGDPCLPGMETFTVLTAGYVLDTAEENISRLELVCHLGFTDVFYSLPIPLTSMTSTTPVVGSVAGPVQMPLAPLSPPIIRSAQTAAAKRLAAGSRPGGGRGV
ncbi:hypothetical protein H5V45_20130 [Nocardioides sp. KIGAM211]|uniref:Uncharacterized protein n=1 Tax=Nocardioides luti TaxID=2761101 RepID=A0A7X0VD29_9ACTN|nr:MULTISPECIES: hypothetical protein [Nocardioides]KQY64591.1 hypothetical protein ASD30_06675 [Nocardioides sp. Root140]KRF20786.1 hypothetical protein ASH02_00260 [Nocardioides sp. Soil796]MBB6629637.1 hypothetical protein [Nocardioides luti]MCX6405590.1 hypothetical protein [Propionibacteriales bacterium]